MRFFYISFIVLLLFIFQIHVKGQNVLINEIMSSNSSVVSDEDGDFSDWIELYNSGTTAVQLEGWGLSDNYNEPFKWIFPEYIFEPDQFLLIWASGKNRIPEKNGDNGFESEIMPLHTNFSINSDGEEIILTTKNGELADEISPVKIPANISYGRLPGNSSTFAYFENSTPGEANAPNGYSELLEPPVFSHQGGFYTEPFQLELNTQQPGTLIIYSLDGSNPIPDHLNGTTYHYLNQHSQYPDSEAGPFIDKTFLSYSYTSPIEIYNLSEEENNISYISTTFHQDPWYLPNYPVEKAITIKAKTVKEGAMPSETVTHTYFVNENGTNRHSLPVISITAQEDELFDFDKGIYNAGKDFEEWRDENPQAGANGGVPANYKRRGMLYEYLASMEFFEKDGTRKFGRNIGLRIHGGWSRANAAKSLRVYARNIYGESTINYPIFSEQSDEAYKRLIFRNSGNDYWYTYFREGVMQRMVKHMHVETQALEPSVLYLNGEYWGIHHIRERYDKHYVARKFDIDSEQIDLLENNNRVSEGDNLHYIETLNYISQYGLTDEEHYDYINTRISVESFIDYMITELFVGNTDWPGNNIKYWRKKTNDYLPGAGPGRDGRWRWMIIDIDYGFGMHNDYTFNMIEYAAEPDGPAYPNPPWGTFLFRKLLENKSFEVQFVTRFMDQLNTALLPEVTKSIIIEGKSAIEDELPNHYRRWRAPTTTATWNNRISNMLNFADLRPGFIKEHLSDFFGLEDEYILTVNVSESAQGHVIVNSLPLIPETQGVAETPYPWSGSYFKKMPLRLEAIPELGFEFVRWENGSSTYYEPVLEVHPESDEVFTAIFEKSAITNDQLIHYWNFNETGSLLIPTYTLISAEIQSSVPTGGTAEITYASGQGFTGQNARFGDEPGNHLRVNNPLGVSLTFGLPTTGFSQIKFLYETRRSGQGAGTQIIEYSVNGVTFIPFTELTIEDADPILVNLDLSAVETVNNNPEFKIRISFAQGDGGTEGNNRFDNITLAGIPGDDVNLPPVVENLPEDVVLTEDEDFSLNLNELFYDPEGDPLEFSVNIHYTQIADAGVENGLAIFNIKQRGESLIEVKASDGINPPIEIRFRMMVFPKAFPLAESNFSFSNWNENSPEMTFPEHMLFLQSNIDDPSIIDPLDFAYYIPVEEYADDDAANVGFPYRNTRRTRLNGLGENGISFINTGRGRDLGGALLAINTTGLDEIQTQWLVGTILQNSREYGLVLQYRIGTEGDFTTLPSTGYITETDGSTVTRGPFALPPELMNQEYVQLLWRYHYLSGTIGPRAQLRLDDILIAAKPDVPEITAPISNAPLSEDFTIEWTATERAQEYELQLADNENFLNPMVSVGNILETSYRQNALNEEQYYFVRVRAINEMTTGDWSEVVTLYDPATSAGMSELDNDRLRVFPNPFNESVHLHFNLKQSGKADIGLFDLSGRKVMTVNQGFLPAGENTHVIEGGNLPAGTYILIFSTGSGIHRKKLIKH